jgi:pseudouridine-5'-phosphate glycosidase
VPATIAIINGVMKVGLSKEEIELLAAKHTSPKSVVVIYLCGRRKNGATTVAQP